MESGCVVYGPENGHNFPYPRLLRVKEKGGCGGEAPHLKWGTRGPAFRQSPLVYVVFVLRLYRWLTSISAPFIIPIQNPRFCLLGGWKGFAQVFINNNHTKSVVGRVLLKFLLIITPKARVILVILREKHRKNDAELFSTFTPPR